MKIIGTTAEGLLLSATHDEVANLAGANSAYSNGYRKPKPGDEIKVWSRFKQLDAIHFHRAQLGKIAAELRAYADRLELHDPVVRELVLPPEEKA